MSKFLLVGDSPIPPIGKTLYKLCQQVFIYNEEAHITYIIFKRLLQDLSILRVTNIYGIYFQSSVQCL